MQLVLKPADFGGFKSRPGENAFIISPEKWVQLTNVIGIKEKTGAFLSQMLFSFKRH